MVYTSWNNAFTTATLSAVDNAGDALSPTPCIALAVYTVLRPRNFHGVLLLLKYEDVLPVVLQVGETMGPCDLVRTPYLYDLLPYEMCEYSSAFILQLVLARG